MVELKKEKKKWTFIEECINKLKNNIILLEVFAVKLRSLIAEVVGYSIPAC